MGPPSRCYRVIGKYIDGTTNSKQRAEEALRRAFDLNPRLSVTHKFYANLEADMGRARDALVRLLSQANRHGNDPELYAGLVHACRYCGLYEESIACIARHAGLIEHPYQLHTDAAHGR
jgi:predicted Zn-dependent protease